MISRAEAAAKVRNLQHLAAHTNHEHESATATKIAEAMIAKFELTPADVKFSPKKKSPTVIDRKLRHLLADIIRTKMWLIYAEKTPDLGAQIAVLQRQMEEIIENWQCTCLANRKVGRACEPRGTLNKMRGRYL